MRAYYYLTQLENSPYYLPPMETLHLGATGTLPLYVYITELTLIEETGTAERGIDSSIYIRVANETISAMEKDIAAPVTTPMHAMFGYSSELKNNYDLVSGILDQRYKGLSQPTFPFDTQQESISVFLDKNLENYEAPKFGALYQHPQITISDLLCWTDDLERLASNGRIQRRADGNSTATSVQTDSETEALELRRTQRTLAALAVGLAGKFPTYRNGNKPNASQLAKLATEHLRDSQSDRTPHGFSETTARLTIAEALKACPELAESLANPD